MLGHKDIENMLSELSGQVTTLTEFRQACTAIQVPLSSDMAAALGTPYRRLTPFLATVVDVIASKLELDEASIKLAKAGDTKAVKKWLGDTWSTTERELWSAAVRDGKVFILTSWNANGPKFTVREAYNGVCGAHVHEEDDTPVWAFNAWQEDKVSYIDYFYPDRIEKYAKGKKERDEWVPRTDAPDEEWPLPWVDSDGNPLGIPITEFSIGGGSDIADAVGIGRDMNETLLDMLASSRTQGWPQRWLKGQRNAGILTNDLGQPLLSSTTGRPLQRAVQTAPGSIMLLSDGSELGQLEPSKADPTVLDKLLELLSFITTVPSHYFSGQWPSGVALIQAESRLNHKVENHQGRLSSAVVSMLRLTMALSNFFAGTAFDDSQDIVIPWHAPQIETEDLKREREQFQQDSLSKLVAAGLMSKEAAIRELHPEWPEDMLQIELVRLGVITEAA